MKEVVTATILSEGKAIGSENEIYYIEINRQINKIPYASIALIDDSTNTLKFNISDSKLFELGKEIEIKLRYEGDPKSESTVFKGIVISQALEVNNEETLLIVELKDKAYGMTMGRKSRVFEEKTDDQIFADLCKGHQANAGRIAKTAFKHEKMVQYYCSDWDFLLSRADANGLVVVVEDGVVDVQEVKIGSGKQHKFEYGINEIYKFDFEANGGKQFEQIQSLSWDIKNQKLTKPAKAASFASKQGNLDASQSAQAWGAKQNEFQSTVSLAEKEGKAWADARMIQSRMAMIQGCISIPGLPKVKITDTLELKGTGQRFSGKTMITGIRHSVSVNGWDTDLQFGLTGENFVTEAKGIQDVPAAGLLPGIHGLQIGVVDKFEKDPEKQYRVSVRLPSLNDDKGIVWARVAAPDAGKDRGFYFRPETGDEVVVGFLNDDPRQALILGGLYSSKNKPDKKLDKETKENEVKGMVTKGGLKILFSDKDKTLELQTSDKSKIIIDEKAKKIELIDINKNKIVMNKDGVAIESAKDLTFKAKGKVDIQGSKIDLK